MKGEKAYWSLFTDDSTAKRLKTEFLRPNHSEFRAICTKNSVFAVESPITYATQGYEMAEDIRNREFIGQGLNWPLQLNAQGGVAMTQGQAEIEQSIRIILETIPGERVMRPEFGCRVWELMFAPRNAATEAQLIEFVHDALRMWEPRVVVTAVDIVRNTSYDDSVILTDIRYQIKNTHDERSIVYPFYIMDEPPTVEDF
jgi:uncharacterized protein